MAVTKLPIFASFDRQRFTQYGSSDLANFYPISVETGKDKQALYPCMGRRHINFLGSNRLVYDQEPREVFRSIDYIYVVVGTRVIQYDKFYTPKLLPLDVQSTGDIWFAYLPVGNLVYCMMTDGVNVFVITENMGSVTMVASTDINTPTSPTYVAAFGNRFVVSSNNTPDSTLTQINLAGTASTWFTIPDGGSGFPLFFRASGLVRQYAVLHNTLYIFTDFSCDIWSNIQTQINVAGVIREFPWKLSSSYNWDYGMQDPHSLDVDFGMMVWLGQNRNGLVNFMMSNGQQPQQISTQAINVLLERQSDINQVSPFISLTTEGFLYQWENTIFYRASAGDEVTIGPFKDDIDAHCLEYNFATQTWGRAIELNGTRNLIKRHAFYNNVHLVTVRGEPAVYDMAGDLYYNELRNTEQSNPQADDAFLKYPMRYELTTKQIFNEDYSEFLTDYVEIDFVFGDKTFYKNNAPFENTVYIVDETSTPEAPVYVVTEDDELVIAENSNTPAFGDNHYYALFKPHIELFYSDDGGITFTTADLREFSPLGQYRWRMRWYSLGVSRNRCYKLICVSSSPIVILGAVQNTRRTSGGAN